MILEKLQKTHIIGKQISKSYFITIYKVRNSSLHIASNQLNKELMYEKQVQPTNQNNNTICFINLITFHFFFNYIIFKYNKIIFLQINKSIGRIFSPTSSRRGCRNYSSHI